MRIERLPRKEFEKKYGKDSAGEHYATEEGEHVVVVPYGASTKTVMHEIAHAKLGHEGSAKTYKERARRELAADSWVYEKLEETPTWAEVLQDFSGDIDELLGKGYSVSDVFNFLKGELENAGYIMQREDRSRLWWFIREKDKEMKRRR